MAVAGVRGRAAHRPAPCSTRASLSSSSAGCRRAFGRAAPRRCKTPRRGVLSLVLRCVRRDSRMPRPVVFIVCRFYCASGRASLSATTFGDYCINNDCARLLQQLILTNWLLCGWVSGNSCVGEHGLVSLSVVFRSRVRGVRKNAHLTWPLWLSAPIPPVINVETVGFGGVWPLRKKRSCLQSCTLRHGPNIAVRGCGGREATATRGAG